MMPMQTFYICCRCLKLSFVLNTFAVPLSEITMRLRVPFYGIPSQSIGFRVQTQNHILTHRVIFFSNTSGDL